MDNLPIPQSRIENLMNAFISRDSSRISAPQSRVEEFWYHLIEGTNSLPIPQSRIELLLKKIIENDTEQIPLAQSRAEEFLVSILTGDINKLPIPQSRSEYYLDYIARNNLVLDDIEYVKYSGTNITASNTVQKPFRSAILKGSTKYRDIDTGEILESFEEGRNLELVSVKMPVLTTTNCLNLFTKDNTVDDGGQDVFGDFVEAKKNDKFSFNEKYGYGTWTSLAIYNVNKERIYYKYEDSSLIPKTIVLPDDDRIAYVRPRVANNKIDTIMFNRGEVIPYEEYKANKTNILTVNEEVELRGIGEVKDELNLITGELTKRIGNAILDGTNIKATKVTVDGNAYRFDINLSGIKNYKNHWVDASDVIVSDNFIGFTPVDSTINSGNRLSLWGSQLVAYFSDTSITTISQANEYLQNNLPAIQYHLATESVKTVDLKVVNQDGNQVKELSAFDGTTHIVSGSASDNSLIAITEVEVPTKLIEVLDGVKSLSSDVEILINEVDNTQKLQDENSTMAMSAMTELYEMILMMGGND